MANSIGEALATTEPSSASQVEETRQASRRNQAIECRGVLLPRLRTPFPTALFAAALDKHQAGELAPAGQLYEHEQVLAAAPEDADAQLRRLISQTSVARWPLIQIPR